MIWATTPIRVCLCWGRDYHTVSGGLFEYKSKIRTWCVLLQAYPNWTIAKKSQFRRLISNYTKMRATSMRNRIRTGLSDRIFWQLLKILHQKKLVLRRSTSVCIRNRYQCVDQSTSGSFAQLVSAVACGRGTTNKSVWFDEICVTAMFGCKMNCAIVTGMREDASQFCHCYWWCRSL